MTYEQAVTGTLVGALMRIAQNIWHGNMSINAALEMRQIALQAIKDWEYAREEGLVLCPDGHIKELNMRIKKLEADLQAFRDFNAPLLRIIEEEEPGAWDHLQGVT